MKLYAKTHEWVQVENGIATLGISEFAAEELGDVTYIEMPALDEKFAAGDIFGSVESVKAASDLFCPIGGSICEINEELEDEPALLNQSAEDQGWICKLEKINESDLSALMSLEEYLAFVRE
ncbi:MAG: glycine cleavage system protein GcvH [Lentisphaeria bacterium]|jgi:glycine cleavage system H protein|nr:glycine cleavage system protein GcvH [Lentisphaeria bacterium]NLZ60070.1 glycine cleavage system protein GcvH [Lentisphaerota bacterium]